MSSSPDSGHEQFGVVIVHFRFSELQFGHKYWSLKDANTVFLQ